MLAHLFYDTVALFAILMIALRKDAPPWPKVAATCVVVAAGKSVLFLWLGFLAVLPLLLCLGLFLRLAYPFTTRKTLYVLGAYFVIVDLASGMLKLFFE